MFIVGARLFPWILHHVSRTGSRELFTLGVIALSLGVAYFSRRTSSESRSRSEPSAPGSS